MSVPTHIMPRAALKQLYFLWICYILHVPTHTMLRAALKRLNPREEGRECAGLDTHNAACGIDSKTALRVLSVTQSRFRMQKAHSNLDDAAHRC